MTHRNASREMNFQIHNECGHPWADVFLDDFVVVAGSCLSLELGVVPSAPVHVVISDERKHRDRFPPRSDEDAAMRPQTETACGSDGGAALQGYDRSAYAHGIATVVDRRHDPPALATLGDSAIYLDIETIESLAERTGVATEAMLARVVAHELSHVFRGHATGSARAVHGWLEEGDAQRDAWWTLNCLLPDPTWSRVARWGRVAQARLSREQPPAYQQFGADEPDLNALIVHDPLDESSSWISRPPRRVFRLVHSMAIEIPAEIRPRDAHRTIIGDYFYLADGHMTAGPWALVAKTPAPKFQHPLDLAAVERERDKVKGTAQPAPQFEWLHLRRVEPMKASRSQENVLSVSRLHPSHMNPVDAAKLSAQLTTDADALAEEIAYEERADNERYNREQIEIFEAKGRPVPDSLRDPPSDPFDDWR
jgi:hypothetical protein